MNTTRIITIATAAFLVFLPRTHGAESISVLLQKAIYAEETEGNLDAAIKIYEGIAKESDANRSLVAQALYRLGICQVKKGSKEDALTAFRTLIEHFPYELELVAKTRSRLTELGQPVSSILVRQLLAAAVDSSGSVSRDGKLWAFVDWDTGDLAVRDIASGQTRRLTNKGPWKEFSDYALDPVISKDGRQVAYAWCTNSISDLRITTTTNPEPRILLSDTNVFYQVADWSTDGQHLLVLLRDNTMKETRMALLNLHQGEVRIIRSLGAWRPSLARSRIQISSDGQFIIYSRPPSAEAAGRDIFVVEVATGRESVLAEHPADDQFLGWAPDGTTLLFSSDRRGGIDLWSCQFHNGKATQPAVLLKADIGRVNPIGITADGQFFYGVSRPGANGSAIYRAVMNFETRKVVHPPARLFSFEPGAIANMSLSPDGQSLVFSPHQKPSTKRSVMSLFEVETRKQRELANLDDYDWCNSPQWFPDNRRLVFRGHRKNGVMEFCLMDTTIPKITVISLDQGGPNVGWMGAGISEETLSYVRWDDLRKAFFVVQRDLATGQEKSQLLRHEPDLSVFYMFNINIAEKVVDVMRTPAAPSEKDPVIASRFHIETGRTEQVMSLAQRFDVRPYHQNRSRIAVVSREGSGATSVRAFDLKSGIKELFAIELPQHSTAGWWGPDGRDLLFLKRGDGNKAEELWGMAADTGELRRTDLSFPANTRLGPVHPATGQVFLQIGEQEPSLNEVWVMENFLPQVASTK
jgi:Tol biopolymer transport system component